MLVYKRVYYLLSDEILINAPCMEYDIWNGYLHLGHYFCQYSIHGACGIVTLGLFIVMA
jgi:hypothetical protein